jgi:hypothetical protein
MDSAIHPMASRTVYINIANLQELKGVNTTATLPGSSGKGVSFGAAVTLATVLETCAALGSVPATACTMAPIARHL